MKRSTEGFGSVQLVRAFDEAFDALWRRAIPPLGGVTLMAIWDRVLHGVSEQFAAFSSLTVDQSGLRSGDLLERAELLDRDRLREAIRSALISFLTVLGNLTAEILTPALHAEMSKLGPPVGEGPAP